MEDEGLRISDSDHMYEERMSVKDGYNSTARKTVFQIDIDRSFITDFLFLAKQIIMLLHNVNQNIKKKL